MSNENHIAEIKRLASEMAFQLKALVIDEDNANKFSEQTIAKDNAEEGLKMFQECDIYNLQKVF